MSYSESAIRLRVGGGEWFIISGQQARVARFFWKNRHRWMRLWDAVLALRSDEVKARLCNVEKKVGKILDRKAGPNRRNLYRLKITVEIEELEK